VQANIAQDLKHLAQQLRIPVVGITQASRSSLKKETAEGMEDASYADAIGQETDLGMRVVKGEKTPFGTKLQIYIAAAREIEAYGFELLVKPFTTFQCTGLIDPPKEEAPPTTKVKVDKSKPATTTTQQTRSTVRVINDISARVRNE
jgi:hypothetical protein